MSRPNFFIIGAPRSGTTSLYKYVKEHPQIYMSPVKEPMFFVFHGEAKKPVGPNGPLDLPPYSTSWQDYYALFRGALNKTIVGEASAFYLYSPTAPEKIHYCAPDAKLVAILRNPIERAYSHYLWQSRNAGEPCQSFAEALAREEERIANGWAVFFHYKRLGLYAEQIERFYRVFNRNQLKIYLYEDFQSDTLRVVRDLFMFLGVDASFVPNISKRYNPYGEPRSHLLHRFLAQTSLPKTIVKAFIPVSFRRSLSQRLRDWNAWNSKPCPKPKLDLELRKQLIEYYRGDILKLQRLISRDLSDWLSVYGECR